MGGRRKIGPQSAGPCLAPFGFPHSYRCVITVRTVVRSLERGVNDIDLNSWPTVRSRSIDPRSPGMGHTGRLCAPRIWLSGSLAYELETHAWRYDLALIETMTGPDVQQDLRAYFTATVREAFSGCARFAIKPRALYPKAT